MNILPYILLYLLVLVISFHVGFSIGRRTKKVDGLFIIDDSDSESTKWILDMQDDPQNISNKKEIHLRVKKMTNEGV